MYPLTLHWAPRARGDAVCYPPVCSSTPGLSSPVTLRRCQCLLLHRRNRNRQVDHLQLPAHLQHLHLSKPTPLSMLFLWFILWISSLLTSSENTASITPSLGRHPQRACPQAMPTISSLHGQAAPKHGHSIPIPCPSP